jgi:DNA-binding transcriptional LysR family regulator
MLHARMLRYLDEVARCGSIRKAAARLNVASSAVNRQILALERELGTPIFERMPRRLRLTASGEILIHHTRNTLKEYERVRQRMDALTGERRGRISLATTLGLTVGPLKEIISAFLRRHPDIQFELRALVADAIPNAVVTGEVDLALSYNLSIHPGLKPLLSIETPVVAVVAPDHPLVARDPIPIADVASYPLVLPAPGMSIRDLLDLAFARLAISARPLLETNSIELIKQLVAEDRRATFLNVMDATIEEGRGELAFLRLAGDHLKPQSLQLITRTGNPLYSIVTVFVEELRTALTAMARGLNDKWRDGCDGGLRVAAGDGARR